MKISNTLFQEIFDVAKKKALTESDSSPNRAAFIIMDVIEEYRKENQEIDLEVDNLIFERFFNPPYEAFP